MVHDWGALATDPACWRPQSVGRIVMTNATLTDEYRWHWVARAVAEPESASYDATINRLATAR